MQRSVFSVVAPAMEFTALSNWFATKELHAFVLQAAQN